MVARLLSSSGRTTHRRECSGAAATAIRTGSSFEKNVAKNNNGSSSGNNGHFGASSKNNGNGSFTAYMADPSAREAALRASVAEAMAGRGGRADANFHRPGRTREQERRPRRAGPDELGAPGNNGDWGDGRTATRGGRPTTGRRRSSSQITGDSMTTARCGRNAVPSSSITPAVRERNRAKLHAKLEKDKKVASERRTSKMSKFGGVNSIGNTLSTDENVSTFTYYVTSGEDGRPGSERAGRQSKLHRPRDDVAMHDATMKSAEHEGGHSKSGKSERQHAPGGGKDDAANKSTKHINSGNGFHRSDSALFQSDRSLSLKDRINRKKDRVTRSGAGHEWNRSDSALAHKERTGERGSPTRNESAPRSQQAEGRRQKSKFNRSDSALLHSGVKPTSLHKERKWGPEPAKATKPEVRREVKFRERSSDGRMSSHPVLVSDVKQSCLSTRQTRGDGDATVKSQSRFDSGRFDRGDSELFNDETPPAFEEQVDVKKIPVTSESGRKHSPTASSFRRSGGDKLNQSDSTLFGGDDKRLQRKGPEPNKAVRADREWFASAGTTKPANELGVRFREVSSNGKPSSQNADGGFAFCQPCSSPSDAALKASNKANNECQANLPESSRETKRHATSKRPDPPSSTRPCNDAPDMIRRTQSSMTTAPSSRCIKRPEGQQPEGEPQFSASWNNVNSSTDPTQLGRPVNGHQRRRSCNDAPDMLRRSQSSMAAASSIENPEGRRPEGERHFSTGRNDVNNSGMHPTPPGRPVRRCHSSASFETLKTSNANLGRRPDQRRKQIAAGSNDVHCRDACGDRQRRPPASFETFRRSDGNRDASQLNRGQEQFSASCNDIHQGNRRGFDTSDTSNTNHGHQTDRQREQFAAGSNDVHRRNLGGDERCHIDLRQANHRYRIGQNLVDPEHCLRFASFSQASVLLTKLPINSPVFVRRTSGKWTYSMLAGRLTEGRGEGQGEMSLVVELDDSGRTRKILERNKWMRCLRLVNQNRVDTSRADASASADAVGADVTGASKAGAASFPRKSSAPESGRGPRHCDYESISFHRAVIVANRSGGAAAPDGFASARSSSNGSFRRMNSAPELAGMPFKSVSFHFGAAASSALDGASASSGSEMIVPSQAANDVDSKPESSVGPSSQRGVSVDQISNQDADATNIKSQVEDAIASYMEMKSASVPRQRVLDGMRATLGSGRSSAASGNAPKPSPSRCHSVPTKGSNNDNESDLSPDTVVAVNLNAKTCTRRRDRMRPMRLKGSTSSMLSLGSLGSLSDGDIGPSAGEEDDVADDATCAPSIGEGSLWSSCSSFNSSNDSPERASAAPLPPYGRDADEFDDSILLNSKGAARMRLRGVDP